MTKFPLVTVGFLHISSPLVRGNLTLFTQPEKKGILMLSNAVCRNGAY